MEIEHPKLRAFKNGVMTSLLTAKENGMDIMVSPKLDEKLDSSEFLNWDNHAGVHILLAHKNPFQLLMFPSQFVRQVANHEKEAIQQGWGYQTSTGTSKGGTTTCKLTILSNDHDALKKFRQILESKLK